MTKQTKIKQNRSKSQKRDDVKALKMCLRTYEEAISFLEKHSKELSAKDIQSLKVAANLDEFVG